MNGRELVEKVADENGVDRAEAKKLIEAIMNTIVDAAAKGEEVSISGFGKFKVKDSPARQGRNPATGAALQIAASRKLTFVPGKAVKDRLNG